MPKFGEKSTAQLETCDTRLQRIFNEVIKTRDCAIIQGHRSAKEQNDAFDKGTSTLRYPHSKHNVYPSIAVDVAPYPINWGDVGSFYIFAGYVMRVADELGIRIRFGGDWDSDGMTHDQDFNDLVHFELVD